MKTRLSFGLAIVAIMVVACGTTEPLPMVQTTSANGYTITGTYNVPPSYSNAWGETGELSSLIAFQSDDDLGYMEMATHVKYELDGLVNYYVETKGASFASIPDTNAIVFLAEVPERHPRDAAGNVGCTTIVLLEQGGVTFSLIGHENGPCEGVQPQIATTSSSFTVGLTKGSVVALRNQ